MSAQGQPGPAAFPLPDSDNWAARLLRLLGWRLELAPPPGPHVLVMVYPHTSNWDFPLGLLVRFATGWPVRWVGKHTLFRAPVGGLLRRLGGIPVDRRAPGGFVEALVAEYRASPRLMVAIAPEGTRKHVDHLKSGFYRIALAAGVPIGFGYIDYATRSLGIAGWLQPSGDIAADLALMREAYAGKRGYHPTQAGEIRLR